MFDLSGKTVCIAGGAGYLGRAVCRGLLSRGARLIVCDIDVESLADLMASLSGEFPRGHIETHRIDIGDSGH